MKVLDTLGPKLKISEQRLARVASYFALAGLLLFAVSLFHPKPLTVILSMSLGHLLGAFSVLLYLVAVLLDTRRTPEEPQASDALTSKEKQAEETPPDPAD